MKNPDQADSLRRATFGGLADFIRGRLKKHRNLKVVSRSDYSQLVLLERELFPDTVGIFDVACVRHAMNYFNYSIMVGKYHDSIESYFSFFPLTNSGYKYCIDNDIKTICSFPTQLFVPRRHQIKSIFLEVIATRPKCPYEIKRDTIKFSISLLRYYNYLPFLSCPVSNDGLRILTRLGFMPINSPGLNKLYFKNPTEDGQHESN
jgi:hypothetical protein